MFVSPLLAVTLAAASASADDVANAADMRCVAVIALQAADLSEGASDKIIPAFMYYLGKIDARTPAYDIEGALLRLLAPDGSLAALQAEAPRCGGEIQRRGEEITAIGEALQRAATEAEGAPG